MDNDIICLDSVISQIIEIGSELDMLAEVVSGIPGSVAIRSPIQQTLELDSEISLECGP